MANDGLDCIDEIQELTENTIVLYAKNIKRHPPLLQVHLVIHGAAPCPVDVSDSDGAGDPVIDVCHLESK